MKKARVFAPQTLDVAQVLGHQIAMARRERKWTAAGQLAERVGVSVRTISNLEHGSPMVAMGVAFEAATLLGIRLFGAEGPELRRMVRRGDEILALLPARVRRPERPVQDDF